MQTHLQNSIFLTAAFGSAMPTRAWTDVSKNYRYGFNGKETDAESGLQDYGFRIYNQSLGRFLSVDPLSAQYPWYTPYQFAGNKVIIAIDIDGLEEFVIIAKPSADGKTLVKTIYYIHADPKKNFTTNPDGSESPRCPLCGTERKVDPNNPLIGVGGVQYITQDADGNILTSERKSDFIQGSDEEYIMSLPVESYSENSDMSESKPGTRRDAMGNYIAKNRPYNAVSFQVIEVAKYDNQSDKMQVQTEQLDNVATKLNNNSNLEVSLVGTTDKDPMTPYITPEDPDGNNRLSKERANDVKKVLEDSGVDSDRIRTHGAGSSQANKNEKDPNDRKVKALIYTKTPKT